MTNGEKYLKDGVDVKQFAEMIDTAYVKSGEYADVCESTIDWLEEQVKPTLTEDERVILRNLDKKYKYISRNCDTELYLKNEADDNCRYVFRGFNHLFKFIKARRRI